MSEVKRPGRLDGLCRARPTCLLQPGATRARRRLRPARGPVAPRYGDVVHAREDRQWISAWRAGHTS